ncbi:MAG: family transposase [Massilia sp.]|jgi:hypothetical protein|nr:family transposase [Massilia sp.]
MESMAATPTASVPKACNGWGETVAAYRFFDNGSVGWRAILEPHWQQTEQRNSREGYSDNRAASTVVWRSRPRPQARSRYPVLKIHQIAPMHTSSSAKAMPALSATLTSETPKKLQRKPLIR